jgi:hypothetical protein
LIFFIGISLISIQLSMHFVNKFPK